MTRYNKYEFLPSDIQGIKDYTAHYEDFCILHTRHHGTVMLTHTDSTGFLLGLERIMTLFIMFHCDSIITCHPHDHYRQHPEIAMKLDILFPECRGSTWNSWDFFDDILTLDYEV